MIRAIAKVTGQSWTDIYWELTDLGFSLGDWGNSNYVWREFLLRQGFKQYALPDLCPACYTVAKFAADHANGTFVLATGSHVVAVIDGEYYDSWNSGDEVPIYYFRRSK